MLINRLQTCKLMTTNMKCQTVFSEKKNNNKKQKKKQTKKQQKQIRAIFQNVVF